MDSAATKENWAVFLLCQLLTTDTNSLLVPCESENMVARQRHSLHHLPELSAKILS